MRRFLFLSRIARCSISAGSAALTGVLWSSVSVAATLAAGDPTTSFDLATYSSGLSQPTDIAMLDDGRAVITQRLGDIIVRTADKKTAVAGHLDVKPLHSEQGLLGVVADPAFATN